VPSGTSARFQACLRGGPCTGGAAACCERHTCSEARTKLSCVMNIESRKVAPEPPAALRFRGSSQIDISALGGQHKHNFRAPPRPAHAAPTPERLAEFSQGPEPLYLHAFAFARSPGALAPLRRCAAASAALRAWEHRVTYPGLQYTSQAFRIAWARLNSLTFVALTAKLGRDKTFATHYITDKQYNSFEIPPGSIATGSCWRSVLHAAAGWKLKVILEHRPDLGT
jgi:hypothetical protein